MAGPVGWAGPAASAPPAAGRSRNGVSAQPAAGRGRACDHRQQVPAPPLEHAQRLVAVGQQVHRVVHRVRGGSPGVLVAVAFLSLGGPSPVAQDLDVLAKWSATVLDTRRSGERRDAVPTTWTPDQVRALLAVAGPLGLSETAKPCRSSYGITVLLGATRPFTEPPRCAPVCPESTAIPDSDRGWLASRRMEPCWTSTSR